jgi:tetratricopeptide (TPR) repeat protein
MGMAVRASSSRDREHSAWCRIQLGNLLFNTGRLSEAEGQYQAALKIFPDYHYALAGMGRVRTAQKRSEEAIKYFEKSIAFLPAYDAVVALGDLHALQNHPKEAATQFQLLETIEQINESHGVQPEAHMAMFLADHDERLPEALQIAQQHARDRRDVRTLDTLAWALCKNGRYTEALLASQKALRLGTKDALLYFHLGVIQSKLGHRTDAVVSLQKALSINPYFHPKFVDEARKVVQESSQIAMRKI